MNLDKNNKLYEYISMYMDLNGIIRVSKLCEILNTFNKLDIEEKDIYDKIDGDEVISQKENYLYLNDISGTLEYFLDVKEMINDYKMCELEDYYKMKEIISNKIIELCKKYDINKESNQRDIIKFNSFFPLNNKKLDALYKQIGIVTSNKNWLSFKKEMINISVESPKKIYNGYIEGEIDLKDDVKEALKKFL